MCLILVLEMKLSSQWLAHHSATWCAMTGPELAWMLWDPIFSPTTSQPDLRSAEWWTCLWNLTEWLQRRDTQGGDLGHHGATIKDYLGRARGIQIHSFCTRDISPTSVTQVPAWGIPGVLWREWKWVVWEAVLVTDCTDFETGQGMISRVDTVVLITPGLCCNSWWQTTGTR